MYANIIFPNDTVFVEVITGTGNSVGSGKTYFISSGVGPQGPRGEIGPAGPQGPTGARGADGVSPQILMTENEIGLTFTITDVNGTRIGHLYNGADGQDGNPGPAGPAGSDYVLTENDKAEIAELAAAEVDVDVPTKVSDLQNDAGYLTSFTETDPTVPAWAKAQTKPTYTAQEVGALPDSTAIPTKVSDLTNDAGYLTAHQDISGKQDALTFDNTPTQGSTNPVTSGGVYNAIAAINTMDIHICSASEYNAQTGVPTVSNPDAKTFYLVPGGSSSNLYIEWVYVNNAWEQFGSATIDLTPYAQSSSLATVATSGSYSDLSNKPTIPTKVSDLQNDRGYLTSFTETDPTVPSWAKASSKPSYTAAEVGALPDNTAIPTKVSDLTNDSGYLTSFTETDPTVPSWAKAANKPTYTAQEVGALPDNTAIPTKVSDLTNDSGYLTAHQDISGKADKVSSATSGNFAGLDANGNLTDSGSKASDFLTQHQSLADYVQKTDYASSSNYGIIKLGYGLQIMNNAVAIESASAGQIKAGESTVFPIAPVRQHQAVFYGLAKAAGDSTQAASNNAVGTYTDNAKSAIKTMLGAANAQDVADVMNTVGTTISIGTYSGTQLQRIELPLEAGTYRVSVDSITSSDTDDTQSAFMFVKNIQDELTYYKFNRGVPQEAIITINEAATGFYIYASSKYAISANDTYTWTNLKIEHIYPLLDTLNNKVNKTDYATDSTAGLVKINMGGLRLIDNEGRIAIYPAWSDLVKGGVNEYFPIVPNSQHTAAFYGLAKAAGDSTQASSSNAVGTYTSTAKTAIQTMLGVETGVTYVENVSGSTPTITAAANTRYICGEVTSLNFTPCGSGICDLIFTSGSTATVLTVPNTVKWPGWFDPTSLSLNTTYEINVLDGVYGVVAVWGV